MIAGQFANNAHEIRKKRVYYEGGDTLYEGYALCYNYDTTANIAGWNPVAGVPGATTDEGNQNEGKYLRVEKPSDDNIEFFAGVVTQKDAGRTGPCWIDIIIPTGAIVPVYTDVSCVIGTTKLYLEGVDYKLGSIGAEIGNAVKLVAIAEETVNRSLVNGIVLARLILPDPIEICDLSAAAGAGPSEDLWQDCPWKEMLADPGHGYAYFTDFMGGDNTKEGVTADPNCWTATSVNNGTLSDGGVAAEGGQIIAASSSTTTDDGMNAQLLSAAVKPAAGKTIWFEARVKVSTVKDQYFVGLASVDTTIITSGALDETTPSLVGFFHDVNSSNTSWGIAMSKAGSNDTSEDVVAMTAAAWTKLGFKFNGITSVEFFNDGTSIGSLTKTTTDMMPVVAMALSLVAQNEDSTVVPTLTVDWVRMAQLR